ncbi:MAG TPA: gas vesicle protein [Blastocatellia bacterium]|nr:gas vesicle protein [Blastocatellia bacterium]
MSNERSSLIGSRPPGLVDVLDRILDKGLVIAGDIKISLANVELLTLQIRLLVCSIDKAEQIGLNWWHYDSNLTARSSHLDGDGAELRNRVADLERTVRRLEGSGSRAPRSAPGSGNKLPGAPGRRRKRSPQ